MSTDFENNQSGEIIDYSGAINFGSALSFTCRDTVLKQWLEAADRFNFSLVKGTELKVTSLDVQYRFLEENGRYLLN